MTKIKIALCQINVVDNKEKNLENARSMIAKSIEENADFIVLPEMFNCPYSNDKFIEYAEEEKIIGDTLYITKNSKNITLNITKETDLLIELVK